MILKFRMLSDENDNFVRDYEVTPEMTLADFHSLIIESLGYDNCMTSFFTADENWERLDEYTLVDMGDDETKSMDSVTLGRLLVDDNNRLVYQFDMLANRAFYLQFVNIAQPNPSLTYPRVAFENAPAPDQYDPDVVDPNEGSIYDEMMGDFNDFEGDDNYDDEY